MSAFQDLAGQWHKNGTREHQVTDEANIVVVTSNQTAGHYDLLVKAKDWDPVQRPWAQIIGIGGLDPAAVRARMNGRLGSDVQLEIRRVGRPPFVVTIGRQLITIEPSAHLRFRWSAQAAAYRAAVCSLPCL
ncbi:MAG: hypothetical protein ACRETD_12165 [Steroidobacteraceae bacterium]